MDDKNGYTSNRLFSPKNIVIYLVVALVVYGAIYLLFLKKNSATPTPTDNVTSEQTTAKDAMTMTVQLEAQNDFGESGTATLTEADGKTTVSINLTGVVDDTPQPAHIHNGACPTPGDVLYPLTDLVAGVSETVLDTTIATLRASLPLAINVHKSAAEASVYVVCGDLQ